MKGNLIYSPSVFVSLSVVYTHSPIFHYSGQRLIKQARTCHNSSPMFYYNKDRVQGKGQALHVFACEIVPISSAFIEQGQEDLKVAYRWNDLNWLM